MTAMDVEHVITDAGELIDYLLDDQPDYSCDELMTLLGRVGRNAGPAVVVSLYYEGLLDRHHAVVVVPDVWSGVEFPLVALERSDWRALFAFAGYTHNGRRRGRPRLPRTLYRGADEAHRDGWSWTDDRAQADWFTDRSIHREPGRVWRATVEPWRLLARITEGRGESEYVVDTDGLTITPAV
ncbi:hypothetical protein SAMN05661080_02908 [Modestobacter sp. DSM 44400]|uniref:hypothetical protein n=1 Tax=Modestobacter sp. DSM 44400 TaxID=1550230 RepID=UPI00089C6018|nr:hypothetical protein [Modestobacter sp. DSM 44400]SDY27370.1 hypothetical protein SAMN05661080_02908 [Modestobacter sp. DSM 44400]